MSCTRETINQSDWRFYFETKNSFKRPPSPATPTALTCSTCRWKSGAHGSLRYHGDEYSQSYTKRPQVQKDALFAVSSRFRALLEFFPSSMYFAGSWRVHFVPPSPCRRMVNFFYRSQAPLSTRNFTMSITPTASTDFTLDPNGAWSPWVVLFCNPGRPLPCPVHGRGIWPLNVNFSHPLSATPSIDL